MSERQHGDGSEWGSSRVDSDVNGGVDQLALVYTQDLRRVGQCVPLHDGLVLGRQSYAFGGRPMEDTRMSRAHAVFHELDSAVVVEDLGSLNGIMINGRTVQRAQLYPGDILQVGDSFFVYLVGAGPVPRLHTSPLLGPSRPMDAVRAALRLVAPLNVPVLLRGPAGVGKMTVARELVRMSGRRGPTLTIGLRDEALDALSFQGDWRGETWLLRGLEDLSDHGQDKLMAWLDGRSRSSKTAQNLAPRLIVTASDALDQAVASGSVRAELVKQLSGWPIILPPLSRRPLDIGAFCADFCLKHPSCEIDPALMWRFLSYSWPDNLRELRTYLERLRTGWTDDEMPPPTYELPSTDLNDLRGSSLVSEHHGDALSRQELVRLLETHEHAISAVAHVSGVAPMSLYLCLERWKLELEPKWPRVS